MKKIKITFMAVLAVMFYSCELETDLEVENLEAPTSLQIGNEATANQLYQGWWNTVNGVGLGLTVQGMSDVTTMSWGNWALRDMTWEPRQTWDNASTYVYAGVTESYFNALHAVLADANAIIAGLESGEVTFSDDDKYESLGKFGQAAALGYLGLTFDRVYASDETGTLNEGEPLGYMAAIELALSKIDAAIAAADRGSFTLNEPIAGVAYSSEEWSEYLNTFAARLLANSARNSQERANLDWGRILNYTQNGLTFDWKTGQDGWINWSGGWATYGVYPGWGRTDLRVISMMDCDYPSTWPADATVLPPASSVDNRLESDYEYLSSQSFREDRGTYHFSSYRYAGLDYLIQSGWTANVVEAAEAENHLYMAEAHLRLGNLQEAANVINSGTRVTRGGLDPIAAEENALWDAIHYERILELQYKSFGLTWFEMRGRDLLQDGTLNHFPIPGAALDAAGLPIYTFGAGVGTPGIDFSETGWKELNYVPCPHN